MGSPDKKLTDPANIMPSDKPYEDPLGLHDTKYSDLTDPLNLHEDPPAEEVEPPVSTAGEAESILSDLIKAPPPEMPSPLPENSSNRMARKRSVARQMQRKGRLSTILTNDDALGG